MKLSFQILRFHILFPRLHLVRIAPDGVDFPVMYDKTVGMGALPARVGVGAETGVYQRDCRLIIRVLQIFKKRPELSHQEHSLICNSPAGQRRHIGIVAALLEDSAHHVKTPVKINPLLNLLRTRNKSLLDTRHTFCRPASKDFPPYRDFPPSKKIHPFFPDNHFKNLLRLVLL